MTQIHVASGNTPQFSSLYMDDKQIQKKAPSFKIYMNYSLCLLSVTQSLFIFVEIFETCTDYNFELNFALQNK